MDAGPGNKQISYKFIAVYITAVRKEGNKYDRDFKNY